MRLIPLLFLLGTVATPALDAQTAPHAPAPVWVNLKSGVYHCPGTEHYGTTSKGKYLPESTAIAQGFHANGGRLCTPGADGAPKVVLKSVTYAGPPPPNSGLTECVVSGIADGDTFNCKKQGSVRVIGVDSPESGQQPFGPKATAALAALMPIGSKVQLTSGVRPRDRYNRTLAYVWLGGKSVNWQMIRQGYAVSYPFGADTLYLSWFDKAESNAKSERFGLWPLGGFDCRPSDNRRGAC